ncbi:MAG: hypothetical protein ABI867_04170 [Kofleriaceae bacterium]
MRDEQVRRYARHILLPDLGGLGQTALLVSSAVIEVGDDLAAPIAASYLAAGGVGTLALRGATESQRARLANHGPDTQLVLVTKQADVPDQARPVAVPLAPPTWWRPTAGDAVALAFWRGGLAATRWMASVANR